MNGNDSAAIPQDENAAGLKERLADIEQRIEELSWRMDRLANQVAQLSYKQEPEGDTAAADWPHEAVSSFKTEAVEAATGSTPPARDISTQITPGLVSVIKLIARGDAESAQHKLYKLPEHELSGQPAVVALVAAALFVQRGDYTAGLKAISRARQLTDNPRLLTLSKLIEQQVRE